MSKKNVNPDKAAILIRAEGASGNTPPPDISKKQSHPLVDQCEINRLKRRQRREINRLLKSKEKYDQELAQIRKSKAADKFKDLASMKRWVPWRLVWNEKRQKFDKVPCNGQRKLSTRNPDHWMTLAEATDIYQAYKDVKGSQIDGVGLVFTDGIRLNGNLVIGFDFDDVAGSIELIKVLNTYPEISPSGKGQRAFAWVPEEWAVQYKDTTNIKLPNCDHCEVYLGSAPRFLTVTFNYTGHLKPIRVLGKAALDAVAAHMKPAEPEHASIELPEVSEGKPVDLNTIKLTDDQKELLIGSKKIDRSAVLHGLAIKLIDAGKRREDVVATILKNDALWQYCLDHRNNDPEKAAAFAMKEVTEAFGKSLDGKRAALVSFNEAWKPPEPEPDPKQSGESYQPFPMDLYENAPGLVRDIAHWIMGASYVPREEFAYASALSMVSCLIGPYCTRKNGKLNLYLILVGGTGTGKNEAFDTMAKLLSATEAKDAILDFPASEAALRRQLTVSPNVLLRVDELAHKFESMRNSTTGASLGRAMLEAYNGARMPPKPYADGQKTLPAVENPYVQIIGGTTDKIWDVLQVSHMEDGTLNRFLFVCLPEDPPYRYNPDPDTEIPKDLKGKLNRFWRDGKRWDLVGYMPPGFGRNVTYGEGVLAAISELHRHSHDIMQEREEFSSLYKRYAQNTAKVAAVLAVGDGRLNVEMADFEQAKKFIAWSLENAYQKCKARLAGNEFDSLCKAFMMVFDTKKWKGKDVPYYEFANNSRTWRKSEDRKRESVIITLMKDRLVQEVEIPKGGKGYRKL